MHLFISLLFLVLLHVSEHIWIDIPGFSGVFVVVYRVCVNSKDRLRETRTDEGFNVSLSNKSKSICDTLHAFFFFFFLSYVSGLSAIILDKGQREGMTWRKQSSRESNIGPWVTNENTRASSSRLLFSVLIVHSTAVFFLSSFPAAHSAALAPVS